MRGFDAGAALPGATGQKFNPRASSASGTSGRQLTISCGCAVFNARASLSASGYTYDVERFPDPARPQLCARIVITGRQDEQLDAVDAVDSELAALDSVIEVRRTNRRQFAEEPVPAELVELLFAAARAEGDALGEQFLLWFLKEQVEEVASATTLLTVATRAGDNLFDLENYVAREQIGDGGESTDAPSAAGGAL